MSSTSCDLVIIMPIHGALDKAMMSQLIQRLTNQLHNRYLVCLILILSVYNSIIPAQLLIQLSFDMLLTTLYSQHEFKSWTLRNIGASWGYGKIVSHFELISTHIMKFCMSVTPFPILALICLLTFLWKNQKTSVFPTSVQQLCIISGWTPTSRNYLLKTFKRSFGTPFVSSKTCA